MEKGGAQTAKTRAPLPRRRKSRTPGVALNSSSTARNVRALVAGTLIAQTVTVAAAPFLTRLYSPGDLGTLAVFMALLSILTVVATGRYELAIPLPKNNSEASVVLTLSLLSTLITSALCTIPSIAFNDEIANLLEMPVVAEYLWIFPIAILFAGVLASLQMWSTRRRQFNRIAASRIGQSIGTVGLQLGCSFLGPVGLIAGLVAGQGIGVAQLTGIRPKRLGLAKPSWRELRTTAKRYKDFPLFSTWTALLNTVGAQFAPILFAGIFGATTAGLYALTLRVLALPATIIGSAVGTVFLASAPEAHREGRLTAVVKKLHLQLAVLGAPAVILILIAGPSLFALVFGEDWRTAGTYARWMAPWIYLQFQWQPLSTLSIVLELQRQALAAQAFGFALRVGSLGVCLWMATSVNTAVLAFSLTSAAVYAIIQLWFLNRAGMKPGEVLKRDAWTLASFTAQCSPAITLFVIGSGWALALSAMWFAGTTFRWYTKMTKGGNDTT